jgi:hypothetical protein
LRAEPEAAQAAPPEPPWAEPAETAPPAEPPAPARERRLPIALLAVLAALLIAAAGLAGWIVGKPEESKPATGKKVSSGTVELALPSGWAETDAPRQLGALPLKDALAAGGPGKGRVAAGHVGGTLPSRVGARVARSPGRPGAVRLGELQAYIWRNVEERGSGRRMTVFAAPTDGGLVALTCRGDASGRARCEKAAGSLTVPGGQPTSLADLDTWGRRLDDTVARLSSRRRRDRARLSGARSPNGSAAAAGQLAKDYSRARRDLAAGGPAPVGAVRAQRAIERSLRRTSSAYRRLGAAVQRQRDSRYRAARRAITRGERELQRTLRGL